MTELKKDVVRTCTRPVCGNRTLVVRLDAGDMISMKEKGKHDWITVTLEKLYYQMVRWDIESQKDKKKKDKMISKGDYE